MDNDESQPLNETEIKKRIVHDYLRTQRKFYYEQEAALGDSIIFSWVFDEVRKDFQQKYKLPTMELISASSFDVKVKKIIVPHSMARLIRYPSSKLRFPQMSVMRGITEELSAVMDVSTIPEEFYDKPPQPRTRDYGALQSFHPDIVIQKGNELLSSKTKPRILIVQAGSNKAKTFPAEYVLQLGKTVKEHRPDADVIIATDGIEKDGMKPIDTEEAKLVADEVIQKPDLHTLGIQAYAADMILTSDNGLAWHTTGCMAMVPERQGYIHPHESVIFYGSADAQIWGIPGATTIESSFVQYNKIHYPSQLQFGVLSGLQPFTNYWEQVRHEHPPLSEVNKMLPEDLMTYTTTVLSLLSHPYR